MMLVKIKVTMVVKGTMLTRIISVIMIVTLVMLINDSKSHTDWRPWCSRECFWKIPAAGIFLQSALHATPHLGVTICCTVLSGLHTQSRRSRFQIIFFDGFLNETNFCIREIIPRRLYSFPCKLSFNLSYQFGIYISRPF